MTEIGKLDRPIAAENWARLQTPDVSHTARKMYNFLRGGAAWSYDPSRKVVRYQVEDRIDRETGLRIVRSAGSKLGRPYNEELVTAFFDWIEKNPIDGVPAFANFVEWFPLRRGTAIPIRPVAVVRESGRFDPIMLCPWTAESLDPFQRSLFMTILERSLFSLTDFEDSAGQILFFPKVRQDDGKLVRVSRVWRRGDYPLLSDTELQDQVRIYFESREIARAMYRDFLGRRQKKG